jgi:hypothetical protein
VSTGWVAAVLALFGVAQLLLVVIYWQATHELARRFPHFIALALIGSALAIFGALCFAIAFLLGG